MFWLEVTVRSCPVIAQQTRITCGPNTPTHTHAHIENTWFASWITAIYFHTRTNAALRFFFFLLSHFWERQLCRGLRRRRAVVCRDQFRSICLPVIPLGPRMDSAPSCYNLTESGQRCPVLHPFKIKLRRKTNVGDESLWYPTLNLGWRLSSVLGGEWEESGFVLGYLSSTHRLANCDWELTESIQDYFKLKFSSKFPLPGCKAQLGPAGHLRVHVCFERPS